MTIAILPRRWIMLLICLVALVIVRGYLIDVIMPGEESPTCTYEAMKKYDPNVKVLLIFF